MFEKKYALYIQWKDNADGYRIEEFITNLDKIGFVKPKENCTSFFIIKDDIDVLKPVMLLGGFYKQYLDLMSVFFVMQTEFGYEINTNSNLQ